MTDLTDYARGWLDGYAEAREQAARRYDDIAADYERLFKEPIGPATRYEYNRRALAAREEATRIRAMQPDPTPTADHQGWQPFDTAPKDGRTLWLASFAPGDTFPRWVAQVSYGSATLASIQCASYGGWFVDPPLIADPARYRGGRAEHGIIYEGDMGPTHWMRPIVARATGQETTGK